MEKATYRTDIQDTEEICGILDDTHPTARGYSSRSKGTKRGQASPHGWTVGVKRNRQQSKGTQKRQCGQNSSGRGTRWGKDGCRVKVSNMRDINSQG